MYDSEGRQILKRETSAYESLGHRLAYQSNALYFGQLFGEDSETCKRALKIMDMLGDSSLTRIKRAYVQPSMFAFQPQPDDAFEWTSIRGFVEITVRKADPSDDTLHCTLRKYRPIVAYLMREGGAPADLFDPKYTQDICNFQETFHKIYRTADKNIIEIGAGLKAMGRSLEAILERWRVHVFGELVDEMEKFKYLEEPERHFEPDQCLSLASVARQIGCGGERDLTKGAGLLEWVERSSLGDDIKKEIAKNVAFS